MGANISSGGKAGTLEKLIMLRSPLKPVNAHGESWKVSQLLEKPVCYRRSEFKPRRGESGIIRADSLNTD